MTFDLAFAGLAPPPGSYAHGVDDLPCVFAGATVHL